MVTFPRPCVALLLAACSVFAASSVAAASPGAGDDQYAPLPCTSAALDVDATGGCDARRPVPEIRTTPAAPRAGGSVALFARSPGRGVTYAWDLDDDGAFDDGDGATLTRTFAQGTRRLRVRATDEDGRTGSSTVTVQFHANNLPPAGSVGLSLSSPRTGQPLTVSAGAADRDGTITRIELDADGDGTYEVDTPIAAGGDARVERTVTFAGAGERTLRARFTDDGGAKVVATTSVDVHAQNIAPTVNLYPGQPKAGKPVTLSLLAEDVDGTIVKREFDLDGNGTFETLAAPDGTVTHTFAAAGPVLVAARVTDDDGATATQRRTVDVVDGNQPPTVRLYGVTDERTLMAIATDDSGQIAEYAWDLDGDGAFDDLVGGPFTASTASVPASVTGLFEVAVRVTDADGASTVGHFVLSLWDDPPGPPAINQVPLQPRAGQPVTFIVGVGFKKIEWDDNGDGVYEQYPSDQLVKTFANPGTYTVRARATDAKGRVVTSLRAITVAPAAGNLPPAPAIVGYSTARTGAPVTLFANVSDFDSTGPATYAWDLDEDGQFDDGADSQAAATFATAGDHEVGLRITDADGGTGTQYKTIEVHTVNRTPRIRISAAGDAGAPITAHPGEPVSLFPGAENSDDPIVAFAWDTDADGQFDDGADAPKTVSFAEPGLHRVYLRGTDSGGLSGVGVQLIDVQPAQANRAPAVRLVLPRGTIAPGNPVELTASATDPDGDDLTFAWDADGDGAFDDGAAPTISYVYAQAGSYDVAVKVTDEHGLSRTMLQTLVVDPSAGIPPTFSLVFYGPVRVGVPTSFATFVAGEDEFTYTFDLDGDGQFDDTPARSFSNFVWTFPTAAPVTVSVRATDPGGRSSTRSLQLTPGAENLVPTVLIGAGDALPGQPITFQAQFSDVDFSGTPSYAWDLDADGQFDDGGGYIVSPTFGPGTHTVSVRVTDGEGGTTIASRTIVVGSRPPVASFSLSAAAPMREEPVTLTSTSTDPDGGPIASTAWDLDDDGAFDDATGPVATTAFATAGARRVGVKVRDGGGDNGIRYATLTVGSDVFVPTPTPTPTPEETATPLPGPGPDPTATPTPPGDKTAPRVTASVKALKLAALLKQGLAVKVGCSEACKLTVVVAVDKATAKRLKLGSKLELGRATGKGGTVTVKLSAKAKAALKRQRSVKVKVTITAVDAAGNRTVTTRTVKLSR